MRGFHTKRSMITSGMSESITTPDPSSPNLQSKDRTENEEPIALKNCKAHWHIFVPTIIIAILYIIGWLVMYFMGMAGGGLARLFVVVLAIGVPILFAHAFLRYQTITIELFEDYLKYHTGWPRSEPVQLPYGMVKKAKFTRGLSGRLFGGGTVVLNLIGGGVVGIADVETPKQIAGKINELR